MPKAKVDDSFELFYEAYDFTDPWKKTDAVLLQHGNDRTYKMWRWYIPRLASQYKVIAPDMRGIGQSVCPPPYTLEIWARDIKTLLDQLGVDKVHYVGEATGGGVGMQFAYQYPERLKSLVLLGSWNPNIGEVTGPVAPDWIERKRRLGVGGYQRTVLPDRVDMEKTDPGMIEWFVGVADEEDPEADAAITAYLATVDIMHLMPEIKTPTLILTGELTVFGLANFKKMHQLMPNSELQIFYGAKHYIFMSHRDECLDAILNFWRRLSS